MGYLYKKLGRSQETNPETSPGEKRRVEKEKKQMAKPKTRFLKIP
jgi:hypothetical protein